MEKKKAKETEELFYRIPTDGEPSFISEHELPDDLVKKMLKEGRLLELLTQEECDALTSEYHEKWGVNVYPDDIRKLTYEVKDLKEQIKEMSDRDKQDKSNFFDFLLVNIGFSTILFGVGYIIYKAFFN